MAVDDGTFVAAGFKGSDFVIARYTSSGTLDGTFGADTWAEAAERSGSASGSPTRCCGWGGRPGRCPAATRRGQGVGRGRDLQADGDGGGGGGPSINKSRMGRVLTANR
jgi:hypothetical protein